MHLRKQNEQKGFAMTVMKFSTAGVLVAVLGLGACTDPATIGTSGSNTQKGAIFGGLLVRASARLQMIPIRVWAP